MSWFCARIGGNISPRFNDAGKQLWLPLLKEAARKHDEHWLAYQLEENETMTGVEVAAKSSGGYSIRHVPHTAAMTQAESQFNRYYILGLVKRGRAESIPHLDVYRAKERGEPRPDFEALVGKRIPIEEIEAELKKTKSGFGIRLARPNSGLSVKLPRT